jgi:hypothetical protein
MIVIENTGHVVGTHVHASVDVTQKRLPDQTDIGKPQHFEIDRPQVAPASENYGTFSRTYSLPDYTPALAAALQRSTKEQTVLVSGDFSYDNGFGELSKKPFCWIWFAHPAIGNSSDQSWFDCTAFPAKLRFWADIESQANKQPPE